jgi:hypothetical protein
MTHSRTGSRSGAVAAVTAAEGFVHTVWCLLYTPYRHKCTVPCTQAVALTETPGRKVIEYGTYAKGWHVNQGVACQGRRTIRAGGKQDSS